MKKDNYSLKLFLKGNSCDLFFVLKNGKSVCEEDLKLLKTKNKIAYIKLLAFLQRISDSGTTPWKRNPEKYKKLKTSNSYDLFEIKTHGIRVLDIEFETKAIILLEMFMKKQNKTSKKDKQSMARAEELISKLSMEGLI